MLEMENVKLAWWVKVKGDGRLEDLRIVERLLLKFEFRERVCVDLSAQLRSVWNQ